MNSDTPNLFLHLKQLLKPISSDLLTNFLYLLDVVHPQRIALYIVALCVCECVCVCVCARSIIMVFVPGV